jgi:hypothetical protein
VDIYRSRDGSEIAVVAATWEIHRKVSFESLQPELTRNPAKFWRNYGSKVGGAATGAALRDPQVVQLHINTVRPDPWDYGSQTLYAWCRGRRGIRYFMHFDLAKNGDRAGIALSHVEPSGVAVVDFMHAVAALPGKNIDFEGLRDLVYLFHGRGFAIELVTYDQWQSEDSRQQLEKRNFQTDHRSADKTPAPYDTLIELLLAGRLDYYNHPLFLREMKQLRTNGVKYDHPKNGSKDVADAVACSVWSAINYELDNPQEPKAKVKVVRTGARGRFAPRYGEKSMW